MFAGDMQHQSLRRFAGLLNSTEVAAWAPFAEELNFASFGAALLTMFEVVQLAS